MAGMKISIGEPNFARSLSKTTLNVSEKVKKKIKEAVEEVQENILQQGRDDISSAGNFGTRWTEGLTAEIEEEETSIRIDVKHDVEYWKVFQTGKTIRGKPLLWIPLSGSDAEGTSARDYPGRLFRVDRKSGGAPLLMSAEDKQVKYTGHTSVNIPKKFHLIEICREEARNFGKYYKQASGD